MFIASSGRGWIVGVIGAGSLLLSDLLTSAYYHDANYYAHHGWPKLVALWVAAGIVQWLLPLGNDEVLTGTDAVSAKKAVLRQRDSLCLIPIKFWSGIFFVAGIGFYFVRM